MILFRWPRQPKTAFLLHPLYWVVYCLTMSCWSLVLVLPQYQRILHHHLMDNQVAQAQMVLQVLQVLQVLVALQALQALQVQRVQRVQRVLQDRQALRVLRALQAPQEEACLKHVKIKDIFPADALIQVPSRHR